MKSSKNIQQKYIRNIPYTFGKIWQISQIFAYNRRNNSITNLGSSRRMAKEETKIVSKIVFFCDKFTYFHENYTQLWCMNENQSYNKRKLCLKRKSDSRQLDPKVETTGPTFRWVQLSWVELSLGPVSRSPLCTQSLGYMCCVKIVAG